MGRRFRQQRGDKSEEIEVSITAEPLVSAEAATEFLRDGDVALCEPIAWGSNYNFATLLQRGEEQRLAIYKPRRGEAPLWDFPDGTLYRREYASYVVSQALGWDFIPTTVIRDGPHGVGTFQIYVDPDPKADARRFHQTNERELMEIVLFDIFANNADRKLTHFLRGQDGKLWGIDHGLTFNVDPKLRTVVWEFCGDPIPNDVLSHLRDFLADKARLSALTGQLGELLERKEISIFLARLEQLVTRAKFPKLDPYRNVPRGFW
ncbi:MAG TPA: SCO1664 family protein [Chloroflexota bacterium]|nr:SCO1664 family protein [Chloroflexota bacterium]